MSLNDLSIFQMARTRMNWLAERQKILATNVANANTPNYVARDLKPFSFKDMVPTQTPSTQPTLTNPMHIKGSVSETNMFDVQKKRRTFELSPDGNNVVLEEQIQKIASNRGRYTLTANLFQKHIGMLKTAIGKGR